MIVSIINQKGGAGKTTLTVNLARYFTKTKVGQRILLVDSDPQGSARTWHELSNGELLNMVALDRPTLTKDIQRLKPNYEWIFIDGVPQVSSMTIAAIKCSDIVLIPVQPSPYDIWATQDTVRFVKDYQENCGTPKAAFVVSRKIVNTNLAKEITRELLKYDLPVFLNGTCQRVAYAESAAIGLTVIDNGASEAHHEIEEICKEIERFAHDLT